MNHISPDIPSDPDRWLREHSVKVPIDLVEPEPEPPPAANGPGKARPDAPLTGADLSRLTSTTYWLERDLPPAVPLLGRGIITTATRMWLVGPTGTGKTQFAMAMASAMATGRDFLHWKGTGRPLRVLYVDGEMPIRTLKKRIAKLLQRMPGADLSNIHWLNWRDAPELARDFPELGEWAPLNTEKGRNFLLAYIDMIGGVDVVVLDNLMALTEGAMKEEDGWRATEPLVMTLTARDIAQLWLDHMGHNEMRAYGTSTKTWKFETVGLMFKPKAAVPGARVAFTLAFDPVRGGKCRERDDENHEDFQTVAVRLTDDKWTAEPAGTEGATPTVGPTPTPSRGKSDGDGALTDKQAGWWKDILKVTSLPGAMREMVVPGSPPGVSGPLVSAISRDALREGLAKVGRLARDKKGNVAQSDRNAMSYMLKVMQDKGKLEADDTFVWFLEKAR
jgi:hypothetical protein